MRYAKVGEHALDHLLGRTVRVDRRLWMILGDRNRLRIAVGRAGARKHNLVDRMSLHRTQQRQRTGDVVAIVLPGIGDRFAHVSVSGKVHHRIRPMLGEDPVHACAVADVRHFERPPAYRPAVAVNQIVDADRQVPCRGQRFACVAADVTGTASDQHFHRCLGHGYSNAGNQDVTSDAARRCDCWPIAAQETGCTQSRRRTTASSSATDSRPASASSATG